MRVVIVFDMEGASHIGDFHELYPMFPEYWETGRRKLTNDIAAAARGLIDGGATEVVVMNHHGAGEVEWPNAIPEELPDGVRLIDWDMLAAREHVDAMFQVGAHARGGSQTFSSHTILPGLRLRVGEDLLSESHWWAWAGDVPVLGIVGSKGLGEGLGSLSDVPFLAVQTSRARGSAQPAFASPERTSEAIRAFAAAAIRDQRARRPRQPREVVLEASIQNGDDAAAALAVGGWTRTSLTEFRIEASAWRGEGEPIEHAILAALEPAWVPYAHTFADLDPTSRETALAFPADRLAETEAFLAAWTNEPTVEWITPDRATHWEGLVGAPQPRTGTAAARA